MKKLRSIKYHVWLIVLSLVGLIAAFWQTAEKIHGLKNPEQPLSCNLNPVVDCGSVLDHPLSAVMGVPNSMIGMIFFTTLLVAGLLVWTGVKLTLNAKKILLLVSTVLLGFSVWFYLVSLYDIGKICIFCIFIWISSVPIGVLTYKEYGNSILNKQKAKFISVHAYKIIFSIYAVGMLLFLFRFRDYYFG